jgi:uncharacterized protein YneF (UPF0154 family)
MGVTVINIVELIILPFLVGGPIVTTAIYDLTLYYLLIADFFLPFAIIFGLIACAFVVPSSVKRVLASNDPSTSGEVRALLITYIVFEILNLAGAVVSLVYRIILLVQCNNNDTSLCHTPINHNIAISELVFICVLVAASIIGFIFALFIQRDYYTLQAVKWQNIQRNMYEASYIQNQIYAQPLIAPVITPPPATIPPPVTSNARRKRY